MNGATGLPFQPEILYLQEWPHGKPSSNVSRPQPTEGEGESAAGMWLEGRGGHLTAGQRPQGVVSGMAGGQ